MDNEIVLSDELWDYYVAVEQIFAQIQWAYALALTGRGMILEGSTYQGNAGKELCFFLESTVGHMQKLMMLYDAAQTYLNNTFREMCDIDELTVWIIGHIMTE